MLVKVGSDMVKPFNYGFTDAVDRDISEKMKERKSLLDAFPTNIRNAVIAGTNTADCSPYINKVLATGGIIDTLDYTYHIGSRLNPAVGTTLVGEGTFIARSDFSDSTYGDGVNTLLRIVSGLTIDRAITFDGNSITTANFWLYGLRNTGPVTNVTLDCTVKNVSFTGIDISRGGGGWNNANIIVRSHVENCGWICVNLEGITNLDHSGVSAYRSGWHAIFVSYCTQVHGPHTKANKSIPPYRIYNGPGSAGGVEKGFLFGHFAVNTALWSDILLVDNRNALEDGFGIGEDGVLSDPESANITVTGQIYDAGQFGFDVSSNMKASVQVFRSLKQGIQFGFDLGGTLANIDIDADVYDVVEDEACRFSATGGATRSCVTTVNSNVVTVNPSGPFYIVPGQKITGTGVPAQAYVGSYNGTTVTMVTTPGGSTPANATISTTNTLTFKGIINFVNCQIKLKTTNCPYGVGIESGIDGYATYSNCEITGDLSGVTNDSVRLLNGDYPSGMRVKADKWKTDLLFKNGSAFNVVGHDRFSLNSGGQFNALNGGYDWQEVEIYINGPDTLVNCDWSNSGGLGDSRLIGNGNFDFTLKSGSSFKAIKRPGVGWYIHSITNNEGHVPDTIGFTQTGTGSVFRSVSAKLKDIPVTPYDFGCSGNNVSNDGAKLQNMFNFCGLTQTCAYIKEGSFVSDQLLTINNTFDIRCDDSAALRFTNPASCGIFLNFVDGADTLTRIELPQLFSPAVNANFEIPGYSISTPGTQNLASRVGKAVHLKGGNRLDLIVSHPVGWDAACRVESTPSAVVANVNITIQTADFCTKGIELSADTANSAGVVSLVFNANTIWAKYPIYFDGTNQNVAACEFNINGQAFTNEVGGCGIYGHNVTNKVDTSKFKINWMAAGYQADSRNDTPTTLVCPFLGGNGSSNGTSTDGNTTIGYWTANFCEFEIGPVMGFGGSYPSASPIPTAGKTIRIRDAGSYNLVNMRYSNMIPTTPISTSTTVGESNYNGGTGSAQYSKKILCSAAVEVLAPLASSVNHYVYHQCVAKGSAKQIRVTPVDTSMAIQCIEAIAVQDTGTNNRQIKLNFVNTSDKRTTTATTVYFWLEVG